MALGALPLRGHPIIWSQPPGAEASERLDQGSNHRGLIRHSGGVCGGDGTGVLVGGGSLL